MGEDMIKRAKGAKVKVFFKRLHMICVEASYCMSLEPKSRTWDGKMHFPLYTCR